MLLPNTIRHVPSRLGPPDWQEPDVDPPPVEPAGATAGTLPAHAQKQPRGDGARVSLPAKDGGPQPPSAAAGPCRKYV